MTSVPMTATTIGDGSRSSRWCPTPEQVMLLEGMYRGGLKTPTSTQIQQITSRLSMYGRVQGKNVFYWFQNHKARDRQKLRKKLKALYQLHHAYPPHDQVGGVEGSSIYRTNVNGWKVDLPSEKTCNLMCDHCPLMSMMMMDPHGTIPYYTRVPPKTLQLFPVTTTADLKEDDLSSTTTSVAKI